MFGFSSRRQLRYPGQPATAYWNAQSCEQQTQKPAGGGKCVYEDAVFEERVKDTITAHDPSTPLFLFWSTHVVHGPLQVRQKQPSPDVQPTL
jgi:hypothetical protein